MCFGWRPTQGERGFSGIPSVQALILCYTGLAQEGWAPSAPHTTPFAKWSTIPNDRQKHKTQAFIEARPSPAHTSTAQNEGLREGTGYKTALMETPNTPSGTGCGQGWPQDNTEPVVVTKIYICHHKKTAAPPQPHTGIKIINIYTLAVPSQNRGPGRSSHRGRLGWRCTSGRDIKA